MSENEVGSKEKRNSPTTRLVIFKQMINQNGLLFRGLKHQMGKMNSKGSSNLYLKTVYYLKTDTQKSIER